MALLAFGGPVAWIYGSRLLFPATLSPPPAARPRHRVVGTTFTLIGGTRLGFLVGVTRQGGPRL